MNGPSALRYLKDLCQRLDQGLDTAAVRKAGVTLAVPALLLSPTACVYAAPEYGAPFPDEETNCADGLDDDYDGQVDCDDDDCRIEACLGCFDGLDNDGNALSDCSDPTCSAGEGCQDLCDDGVDNDGDNRTDCDDADCAGSPACP